MTAPQPQEYARKQPDSRAAGDFLLSLVSAGLFLYVGFGMGLVGASGDALYDGSVAALVWGARIVGFGILIAAAMSYFNVPGATLLDLALSVTAAAGCLVIGVIWMVYEDAQGFLLLLFGLLNASAVRAAWQRWHASHAAQVK
jgi:hypothetical protein